ncbi:glycoside hydrolase family 15 protein [Zunongwangia sp. HGR-M22]|uniref:glycoside hydrolase family 15 protein n=1 Tax=Zunongwangia sp. HGR-M22 TaxID=3015168 RepID=UPI0022DDEC38|nr:glycoside hydrolase family 15 protein [Zunongwangia sp. HGR-M22]WBL26894.1 glycoside hydrolase family 15 protein [Zunongwangia sp. HGR-M22]
MIKNRFTKINNYGFIGNLQTTALVSQQGDIDFMCFPNFDSPSVFATILDGDKGGCFSIEPLIENLKYTQFYITDTATLITRFTSEKGVGEISDTMVIDEKDHKFKLLRKVSSNHGNISFRVKCKPRFDNAKARHTAKQHQNEITFTTDDDKFLCLNSCRDLYISRDDAYSEFKLDEKESCYFILTDFHLSEENKESMPSFGEQYHWESQDYWKKWISKTTYKGRWIETIIRSAITLKLLTSHKEGSIIAAPTFGLPEKIGGERNWDHRYTWIRDAAFAMYAFMKLGFKEEASAFFKWVEKYCFQEKMDLVYTYDGKTPPDETTLEHFNGYKNSKPVRVGNDAKNQKQLDIYGELIDAVYVYNLHDGSIKKSFWKNIKRYVEYVCDHWKDKDRGIWEIRGDKKEFLHSRLTCWIALDRGIKLAENNDLDYPKEKWEKVRTAIKDSIYSDFWNEKKEAFVQHSETDEIDASVMLMPILHFIDKHDEKWKKTLEAVERELKYDVLIYRYRAAETETDGLEGEEGTFTMCSFWYIECLALMDHVDEAAENFSRILGYGNSLRLFSEQISKSGEQVGNFPQALTHLALINACLELNKKMDRKNNA